LVFENERPGLRAMAFSAIFIQAGHGQTVGRFHDAQAMGIVALHTVHFAFNDRMMLREVELRVDFHMALETGGWVLAGIDYKFSPPTTRCDVFAGGAMTGFATLHARHLGVIHTQARVRTGRKRVADGDVAIHANLIANVGGALDLRRFHQSAGGGTGIEKQSKRRGTHRHASQPTPAFHGQPSGLKAHFESGHLKL
jgi:hypothetical protein